MKHYFNQDEQGYHLIILSSMQSMKSLIEHNALSPQEEAALKTALKKIDEFSNSVFERLGNSYKRSLKNKAQLNTLRFVSRAGTVKKEAVGEDWIDKEYLIELLDMVADIECEGCKRTDCKSCNIYKMKSYLNYNGNDKNDEFCPFRKEVEPNKDEKYDFDFD